MVAAQREGPTDSGEIRADGKHGQRGGTWRDRQQETRGTTADIPGGLALPGTLLGPLQASPPCSYSSPWGTGAGAMTFRRRVGSPQGRPLHPPVISICPRPVLTPGFWLQSPCALNSSGLGLLSCASEWMMVKLPRRESPEGLDFSGGHRECSLMVLILQ